MKVATDSTTTLALFPEITEEKKTAVRRRLPEVTDATAKAYWDRCLDIIRDNVSQQVFRTWFEQIIPAKWEDSKLTVVVPSQFFFEWIEEHYYDLLRKTIDQVLGPVAKLQYQVIVNDCEDSLEDRTIRVPAFRYPPSNGTASQYPFAPEPAQERIFPNFLNPRYVFDNFITGDSNQLATSAASAISQNPGGTRFNPLVVYGETGLGKTHLVQAIGNHIIQNNPKAKVLYTNSERFYMDFITSIQNNKSSDFVNFYRSVDVLIVDDIQFFSGKEKTQDNFFHTFNALHQAGKQIIMTSDKPPRELKGVDDRLISRFQWGLTVDIQRPDLEMRMAILQRKSQDESIELPYEIIEFLAKNVRSSVRELEGTLISLIAKHTLDRKPMSLDLAREVVEGIATIEKKPMTMDVIKNTVSDYFKMPIEMMESKVRKHEVALSRQMCMYLAKRLTQMSLKSIGAAFGGRDHSTVLHSCQTIDNYLATDKTVKASYEFLLGKLKQD